MLQMKAEFFKDENGFIWLFYIKNVHMRKSLHIEGLLAGTLTAADVKKQQQQQEIEKNKAKQQLIDELEQFEKECSTKDGKKSNSNVINMIQYMNEYYDDIKSKKELDEDAFNKSLKDIVRVQDIIKLVYPETKAKSFKQLLKIEENYK